MTANGWRPALIDWLLVGLIGLLIQGFWAVQLKQPTYMDAYYYTTNGQRLAAGEGFEELIIWQFLDDPAGLPTPSHTYWMPLTSILAAVGYSLTGTFTGAQFLFWLLGGLLPLLAFAISWQLVGLRWQAWVAALFTAAGSFYASFLSQPSTFAPFAWAGGLCLLLLALASKERGGRQYGLWFSAGLLAGLAHLTRADGLLFLVLAAGLWGWRALGMGPDGRRPGQNVGRQYLLLLALLVAGYSLVMGGWFARTWQLTGRPLTTVGTQTVFLTTYDDLFAYGRAFDLDSYLAWGWGNILLSKLRAVWLGLQTLISIPGLIFLTPFIVVGWLGGWRRAEQRAVLLPVSGYTVALFLVLTLLFTFPGQRGSLFHSSIVLWPWTAALAAAGIGRTVDQMAAWLPHWQPERAKRIFSGLFVLIALIVSFLVSQPRLAADDNDRIFDQIAAVIPADSVVMVGVSPAFYYHTRLPAVSVPNEPIEVVLEAAERYQVAYLILDGDHPAPLRDIYTGDRQHPRVELVGIYGQDTRLYKILE